MATNLDVFQEQRITLARFARAVTGDPLIDKPDIDDRGFDATDFGSLVGITEGDTITVKLVRVKPWMDDSVELFLTSTDTKIVTVSPGDDTALPKTAEMEFQLTGVAQTGGGGQDSREAKIQVHVGKKDGPIIHELHVHVFTLLNLRITPHFVNIHQTGQPATSGINTQFKTNNALFLEVVRLCKAIWRHCGIDFSFGTVLDETVAFATAGIASDSGFTNATQFANTEIAKLLQTNFKANTINVYFVNQIGTGNTLGFGFSRTSSVQFKTTNPGIVLGDKTASSARNGAIHWANDLAHEAGHFLRLQHVDDVNGAVVRFDSWSRRMLMHNFNGTFGINGTAQHVMDGVNTAYRVRIDDAGYGTVPGGARRGCMVMLRKVPNRKGDDESVIARATINSNNQF